MLLRQRLKVSTDIVELIDFAQDCLKRHGHTALSQKRLRWGELQMDWLRSEDLKEEKVITTPAATIPRQKVVCLLKLACDRSAPTGGWWVRRKPRNNQPKRPSPKSSRKWQSREWLCSAREHSQIVRNRVLVVENDVEK
jgi:hypothetical protein